MKSIVVDPVLESVCRELTPEEFATLEKLILRDGCRDALCVWERADDLVLLDGHNRKKICEKHSLPYETKSIQIDSIEDAIVWIIDNQDGRRNNNPEQAAYISGMRYEAQKIINQRRDVRGLFKSNDPLPQNGATGRMRTSQIQANKEGIGKNTVERNAEFARGVNAVREVAPDLAESILTPLAGKPKLNKSEVRALSRIDPEELSFAAKEGIPGLKALADGKRKAEKEAKELKKYQQSPEFQARMNDTKKIDEAVKQSGDIEEQYLKETFGVTSGKMCVLARGTKQEYWCRACKNGFDTYYIPNQETAFCPYCGGKNIRDRLEDWYPNKPYGDGGND